MCAYDRQVCVRMIDRYVCVWSTGMCAHINRFVTGPEETSDRRYGSLQTRMRIRLGGVWTGVFLLLLLLLLLLNPLYFILQRAFFRERLPAVSCKANVSFDLEQRASCPIDVFYLPLKTFWLWAQTSIQTLTDTFCEESFCVLCKLPWSLYSAPQRESCSVGEEKAFL